QNEIVQRAQHGGLGRPPAKTRPQARDVAGRQANACLVRADPLKLEAAAQQVNRALLTHVMLEHIEGEAPLGHALGDPLPHRTAPIHASHRAGIRWIWLRLSDGPRTELEQKRRLTRYGLI